MAKKVTLSQLSRLVRDGAVVTPNRPVLDLDVEIAKRLPASLSMSDVQQIVDDAIAVIPGPVTPDVEGQVRRVLESLPPPSSGVDGDSVVDVKRERDAFVFIFKSGKRVVVKMARDVTVVQGPGATLVSRVLIDGDEIIVADTDDILVINSAIPVTVMLPLVAVRTRPLYIKRVGLGAVTVQGVETIDGDPYKIINTRYTTLMLAPLRTEWVIL